MAGNIAQPNMNKETSKLATRTPYVDTTTLPSPQRLNGSFRRELVSHHKESEATKTTTLSRTITTLLLFTQLNTQEDDIMDANDKFEMSPQEFDTIIQDANNKRSLEINTSTSSDTVIKIIAPTLPPPRRGRSEQKI